MLAAPLEYAPRAILVRAWFSLAYIFPGLHPEGFDDSDSDWPCTLKPFAVEAWRRADAGDLADDELYSCDAQWAGHYYRMTNHTSEETERRRRLADSLRH